MQRSYIQLLLVLILGLVASCNTKKTGNTESSKADTLYNQLLKEHEVGMEDWMKIEGRQKRIKAMLDSLATLPDKTNAGIAELKNKLNEATTSLQKAYDDMDSWMSSMNLDSAKNDLKQRIKYLTEEKLRAGQVNEMILKSIQKADSLLKVKF